MNKDLCGQRSSVFIFAILGRRWRVAQLLGQLITQGGKLLLEKLVWSLLLVCLFHYGIDLQKWAKDLVHKLRSWNVAVAGNAVSERHQVCDCKPETRGVRMQHCKGFHTNQIWRHFYQYLDKCELNVFHRQSVRISQFKEDYKTTRHSGSEVF